MQLGLLYAEVNHPIALDYLKNAHKVRPESMEARYAIAMFHQQNEEARTALNVYQEMLEVNPGYFNAWYNQGFIYLQMLEKYDSAAYMFTKAIETGPQGYFAAFHNRGLSHERAGDLTKAEADYRMALQINPQYDLSAMGLSRILDE